MAPPPAPPTPSTHQLLTALTSQNLPTPSPTFLSAILTLRPSPSIQFQSLFAFHLATAKHRLISSDLTLILAPTNAFFPSDIANVRITTRTLTHDVFVQIMDVDDLGKGKWEQIDALESERKGETVKGREIVRVVAEEGDGEEGNNAGSSAATQIIGGGSGGGGNARGNGPATAAPTVSKGPFKVLLEDWKGDRVYGFEVKRVEKIASPPVMRIGCKILLRKGTEVARGMVLLEPATVLVLGGKIDAEDKEWREKRERVLRERIKKESEERGGR